MDRSGNPAPRKPRRPAPGAAPRGTRADDDLTEPDDDAVARSIEPTIQATARTATRGATRRTAATTSDPSLEVATAASGDGQRFSPVRELGRGGMGVVHVVYDHKLRREIALKTLLVKSSAGTMRVSRFVEEAQITGQLEHPNIIPVHDLGVGADGNPWLAMKLVHGRNLRELINDDKQTGGPLTAAAIARSIEVMGKVCDAVGFAHSRGVIHRDLKPDNIMVGQFGEVMVMDWGIARPIGAGDDDDDDAAGDGSPQPVGRSRKISTERRSGDTPALTADGKVMGTPSYMAPEQAQGKVSQLDARSDVFALGAILYHLLALLPPYQGGNAHEVLKAAADCRVVPPARRAPARKIPRELDAIVMKAMRPRPRDRYASAADLKADLDAYAGLRPVTAVSDGPLQRAAKWVRRHPGTAVAGTLSAVFVAILGAGAAITLALADNLARSEQQREIESAQAARAAAEAAKARAEAATIAADSRADQIHAELRRREAESRQRDEEMKRLAAEGKFDRLRDEFGLVLREQRDADIAEVQEYIGRIERETGRQVSEAELVKLPREKLERWIRGFERLFKAHETLDTTEVTANDYYYYGLLLQVVRNDLDGAIAAYTAALKISPGHLTARGTRANLFARRGQHELALSEYKAIYELLPTEMVSRWNAVMEMEAMGDGDAAFAALQEMVRVEPRHGFAWHRLAEYHIAMKQWQEALECLNKAIPLDPVQEGWVRDRARANRELGNNEAVVADCSALLKAHPDAFVLLHFRAEARFRLGDAAKAEADWNEAARLAPDQWVIWHGMATMFLAQKRWAEARTAINNAERCVPDNLKQTMADLRKQLPGGR
ncbi:MAG: protein kinase [Planctomycetota bacterium]